MVGRPIDATINKTMIIMKKTFIKYISVLSLIPFCFGCLESDDFDGLTDVRPEIGVEFPDRVYSEFMGLAYIGSYNEADSLQSTLFVTMELSGEEANIQSIRQLESRGSTSSVPSPSVVVCNDYITANPSIDLAITPGRSVTFEFTVADIMPTEEQCDGFTLSQEAFWDILFTVVLDNDEEVVTQEVRVGFIE